MYCKHCGTVAVGKYCFCCGRRLRDNVDEFNATRRKMAKNFSLIAGQRGKDLAYQHLASACWIACEIKHGKDLILVTESRPVLAANAYERREIVKAHAAALYERLKAESF